MNQFKNIGEHMTKEVLVSISGLFHEVDEKEKVELATEGEYFNRNEKHFILFDEPDETGEIIKNTIKISDNQIDIIKRGVNNVHMVFHENKESKTNYNTPFGNLIMQMNTTSLLIEEGKNQILIDIKYDLSINDIYVSECFIQIKIQSKG